MKAFCLFFNLICMLKDSELDQEIISRVWIRYVDDIFAIFDTNKVKVKDFVECNNFCWFVDIPFYHKDA